MAGKSNNSAAAVVIQTAAGTMESVSSADCFPMSQLRPNFAPVTVANDEYTGSPVKNADTVAGSRKSFSFNVKIRGPGTLPAANTWKFGMLMQAMKFTELRLATAIHTSPEAVAGAGQTATNVRLGTNAGTVADAYNGYPLILSDNGSGYKNQITSIFDYDGSKNATIGETLGAPAGANYQIPTFIGYARSITADDPVLLSMSFWLDGLRYDLRDCRVTSAQLTFPTSSVLGGTAAYPELQITVEGILDDYADEATPSIPSLGAIPLFRNGDMWLNRKAIGGASFTIDLGLQTEAPPNPNQADGSDGPELVATTARITMQRIRYLKAVNDTLALAEAQTTIPFWAQYGAAAGAFVQIGAWGRLAPPTPDMGGGIIMESSDLLIDALDRGLFFAFPC